MPTKINEKAELQVIDYRYDLGIRGRVEYDILPTLTTMQNGFSSTPMIMKNNGGGRCLI